MCEKKVKIGFVSFIYSSKYHGNSVNFFAEVDFCEQNDAYRHYCRKFLHPTGISRFHQWEKHSSSTRIRYFYPDCQCRVARRLFGIQLVSVLNDGGMKERKRANSDPKTSDAVVAGRTNDHRVRGTRKSKVLKTKNNRRWFAPPFHPLLPRIHFSPCVSARISRRRCCLKDANISLSFVACGISRSLFPPDSVAFLMSYLSTHPAKCTHCRFCSNRCAPVIYDDSCRNQSLCRGFRADNARFRQKMIFKIIALFRISAWCAAMFSSEKNTLIMHM